MSGIVSGSSWFIERLSWARAHEMGSCENQVALENVRTGASKVGMDVRMREDGATQRALMEKWSDEILKRCPICSA